jgi:hypothetical protein
LAQDRNSAGKNRSRAAGAGLANVPDRVTSGQRTNEK